MPDLEPLTATSPERFIAQTRARVAALERTVRDEAFLGNVSNESVLIARGRGRAVIAAARAAASDGHVTAREVAQVGMLLHDAEVEALGAVPLHRTWNGGWRHWR